jgi:hypothetical protein
MDSAAYDSIAPQVPFHTFGFTGSLIIESQQGQFHDGLGRVNSTPACICKIENISLSAQNCSECKKCKQDALSKVRSIVKDALNEDEIEFIGDSGASATFTPHLSDFTEYHELATKLEARTANKGIPLSIKGSGTVFLKHKIEKGKTVTIRLNPVFYIPGLSMRLMSIGEWLQQGCILKGTKLKMAIQQGALPALTLYPKGPGETIYWLKAELVRDTKALVSMSTLFQVDSDLMHRRMGHPSDEVLRQAKNHTDKFPKDLIFEQNRPICRGCAFANV